MQEDFTLNDFLAKYGLSFDPKERRELGSKIAARLRSTSKFKGRRLPKIKESLAEFGRVIKCKVTLYPVDAEKYIQDEVLKYITKKEHEKSNPRRPKFRRRY